MHELSLAEGIVSVVEDAALHQCRLSLPVAAPARVLAFGAWLKNTAGLLDGAQFIGSALHGDLDTPEACAALDASVETLVAAASGPVDAVAHDLHPDFYSTRLAQAWAERLGVPAIAVQHHHAHLAVVQAEQGWPASARHATPAASRSNHPPMLGLALDGVGLGTDGTAWGGELLLVRGSDFERLGHLPALALPGGDVAAREPWRMAAAVLQLLGRHDEIETRFAPLVRPQAARIVATLLARGLNCPVTTSAGRWFDAAAGVLGLSVRQSEEAEAAQALERAATAWLVDHPDFDAPYDSLDLRPLFTELLALDPLDPTQQGEGAARFHLALAHGLAATTIRIAATHGIQDVVLGGGCFFNRLLSERLTHELQTAGLKVQRPHAVNCGDAGLALGQAWVGALCIG
ncbi:MAG: carbamoyltransferase HypF [Leptothrix sp. (in: b-proteobacteria)]